MSQHIRIQKKGGSYSIWYNFSIIFQRVDTVFFVLLSVLMLFISGFNRDFNRNVSFAIIGASMPVVEFASFPFNSAINLVTDFEELVNAKKENKTLKEDLEKLRSFYITSLHIHQENKELKTILNFVSTKSSNYKLARIIGRSQQIFSQKLLIDAGSNRGIKEGSIVGGNSSIIGRAIEIGEDKSRLILLTDSQSKIPVITSKAGVKGILVGGNKDFMEIIYLPKNHNIQIGDWVFTSGDGDTLPPGLLAGIVTKVDKSHVMVSMAEDLSKLEFVTIMDY